MTQNQSDWIRQMARTVVARYEGEQSVPSTLPTASLLTQEESDRLLAGTIADLRLFRQELARLGH